MERDLGEGIGGWVLGSRLYHGNKGIPAKNMEVSA